MIQYDWLFILGDLVSDGALHDAWIVLATKLLLKEALSLLNSVSLKDVASLRVALFLRIHIGLARLIVLLLKDIDLCPQDVDLLLAIQILIDVPLTQKLNLVKDLFIVFFNQVIRVKDLLKLLESVL